MKMSELDKILKMSGTVYAGYFTPEGECTEYKGKKKMTKEMADMAARYCAALTKMLGVMGDSYEKITKAKVTPMHGFVYCGGDLTLFVGKDKFAFVDETADWNDVSWALLMGKYPEE